MYCLVSQPNSFANVLFTENVAKYKIDRLWLFRLLAIEYVE